LVVLGKFKIDRKDEEQVREKIERICSDNPKLRFKALDFHYVENDLGEI
jgi:hypothetical protein